MNNSIVDSFQKLYSKLDKHNIHRIDELYASSVVFIDPFHEVHGLDSLKTYLQRMYANVDSCRFAFTESFISNHSAALFWNMQLVHHRLNGGKPLQVPGSTLILYKDKVTHHHDYFDAGALVYENVPLLSSVINLIKRQL